MLTAARLILEEKARFHNATVILVVDRTELEGQLKGWVERLLGEMKALDIATERADSKAPGPFGFSVLRLEGPIRSRAPFPLAR